MEQTGESTHSQVRSIVGEKLTDVALRQLSGEMSGYPFIKIVLDIKTQTVHFINDHVYKFHVDYIAENLLDMTREEARGQIDELNKQFYLSDKRHFYLGILAFHKNNDDKKFFTLETVEVDNMNAHMIQHFYHKVKEALTLAYPLYLKPANHLQESYVNKIDPIEVPRIFNYELVATKTYIPLNKGETRGRLRVFRDYNEYRDNRDNIEWYDILVMNRVPDNIPRVSGIINSEHTTPLSHTNVLAHGWLIPNAIQIGILQDIEDLELDGKWVSYIVDHNASQIEMKEVDAPDPQQFKKPEWTSQKIKLEKPESKTSKILNLVELRKNDRRKYGTKAANIGELNHLIKNGSSRLIGHYKVKRDFRPNLLPYLSELLNEPKQHLLQQRAHELLVDNILIPRGIAIPFSLQQRFLESSPQIQQQIGKLKMALELGAKEVDALCIGLQRLIKKTPIPQEIKNEISSQISTHLKGAKKVVVRSSSNAEDLNNFSAAGIYESKTKITTMDQAFAAIKSVWASLVASRTAHLRKEAGIPLDDTYMGVTIQEQIQPKLGGVLVTTNPMNPKQDIRNVYINATKNSVEKVVDGTLLPYQFLYNTMEGGGRTMSLGSYKQDLSDEYKKILQRVAIIGRLLQSHFSPDLTFEQPVDIEWATDGNKIYILQLRPYSC